MELTTTNFPHAARRLGLVTALLATACAGRAQVLIDERFDGGASTTGFTISADPGSSCQWTYAPDAVTPANFNDGPLPSGAGFDSDFAFIDSDECADEVDEVSTFLTSEPFDASAPGIYVLSFAHQFQYRAESFARVEVFNGDDWVQVANWTGESIGYPNPAVVTTLDITDAAAGSTSAQVRFHFSSGYDWWWALDNISVTLAQCAFPQDLAVTDLTTESATFTWDDNGAPGYEWVVTTGAVPDGTNGLASGDGTNTTATGLLGGTGYSVFVRALCDGEGTSAWSDGVPFVTSITNDEPTGAMALTVNPGLACGTTTHGTVLGATDSGLSECNGTPDDDVWFTFTATNAAHVISLLNVSGSTTDMMIALWTGDPGAPTLVAGSCSDPESVLVSGLTGGETYYVQVYTYTSTAGQDSQFDVCIGTPPPASPDEPCDAQPVTVNPDLECSSITPAMIAGATGSGVENTCNGTADDDVWFSFVATATTHYVSLLDISGTTTDLYTAVYSGDCDDLALVPNSCSDPEFSSVSGLTPGETYFVQVYTYSGDPQTVTFSVCIGTHIVEEPPANDDCAGALPVTVNPDLECGSTTHGTVADASGSGIISTCNGTADDDVWFSFVATNPAHVIDLLNIDGTTTDLYTAVYSGDCGALTLVPGSCSDPEESMVSGLTIGETYYVQVYTYTAEPLQDTEFDLCIGTPGAPPANDECSGAVALTVNPDLECDATTPGTVAGATGSNLATTCNGTADDDVWFSFTALATTHTIELLNVDGSTDDLYMALWSGNCDALTLVPESCSDPEELEISGLTVGQTYYLQVYTYTSTPLQNTTFDVCVGSDPDDFPLDCEGVPGGDAVPGSPCINEEFNVGGTWTENCLCQPNVGIAEISAPALITLAPNPASTELYLTVPDARTVSVRIYDMLGHLVMQQPMAKHLSIAQLAPGSYSLVAVDAQAQPVGRARFVKQ